MEYCSNCGTVIPYGYTMCSDCKDSKEYRDNVFYFVIQQQKEEIQRFYEETKFYDDDTLNEIPF